jgi:pimeloyl-ACP methyl ester carboxylesterase
LAEKKGRLLRGKLHIIVGDKDEFGLDRPVRLLHKSLAPLGSPVRVTIVRGAGHFTVWRKPAARLRYRAMAARWKRLPGG